jgi:hypothetical protein
MGSSRSGSGDFFADADFDYEARIVLGAADVSPATPT